MNTGICIIHKKDRDINEEMKKTIEQGFYHCQLISWDNSLWTGEEEVKINQALIMDTTHCGSQGIPAVESAPLVLDKNGKLELTIYIDHTVIEVFANDRQAITRYAYQIHEDSVRAFISASNEKMIKNVFVHEIAPTNFY